MHGHFSQKEIDRFCANIRKSIIAGSSNEPGDACTTRVAKVIMPEFARFLLEELNRGTPSDLMAEAVTRLLGQMVAQSFAGAVVEAKDLDAPIMHGIAAMCAKVAAHACEICKGNADTPDDEREMAMSETVGHA